MSEVKDKNNRTLLTTTRNEVVCQECGTKNKKQNLKDFLISLQQRSCYSCGSKLNPRYDEIFKGYIIMVVISATVFAIGAATYLLTTIPKIPMEVFLGLLQLISILLGAQIIVVFYYYSRIDQQRTAYLDSYHKIFSRSSELHSLYTSLMEAARRELKEDKSAKPPVQDKDAAYEEKFKRTMSSLSDLRSTMNKDFSSVQHSIRLWITATMLSYASAIVFSVFSLILVENSNTRDIVWFLCSITAAIIIAFVSFERVWSEKEILVKKLLEVTEKQNDMIQWTRGVNMGSPSTSNKAERP
jgi:hypothetical protein